MLSVTANTVETSQSRRQGCETNKACSKN